MYGFPWSYQIGKERYMDSAKYELRRVWTEPAENAVGKNRNSSVYLVGNIK